MPEARCGDCKFCHQNGFDVDDGCGVCRVHGPVAIPAIGRQDSMEGPVLAKAAWPVVNVDWVPCGDFRPQGVPA